MVDGWSSTRFWYLQLSILQFKWHMLVHGSMEIIKVLLVAFQGSDGKNGPNLVLTISQSMSGTSKDTEVQNP